MLDTVKCGDMACMTMAQLVVLATWINNVTEFRKEVTRCPYVETHD